MKKTTFIMLAGLFFMSLALQANNNVEHVLNLKNASVLSQNTLIQDPIKENTKTVYLWEVETNYGVAKGYSPTMEKAKEMISLMSTKDLSNFEIIQSGKIKK